MDDVTILALAALCWGAAGWKAWTARRHPGPSSQDALWSSLGSLGAGLTLFSPPGYRGLYRITGIPNIAELAGHTFVLVSASQARSLLIYLEHPEPAPPSVRRQRGLLLLTVAGMTAAFRLAPVDQDSPGSFTRHYASAPWVAEYWAVFLLNLGGTLAATARQSRQLSAQTERPPLRQGLRLIAAGCWLGIAYFAHWGAYLVLRRHGRELPALARSASRATAVAAVTAVVTGCVLPAAGPALQSQPAVRRLQQYRSLRRLRPLWRQVCAAVPAVALDPPAGRWADLRDVRDLEHRRYRRVIEIRDGWLALRPFMSAGVRNRVGRDACRAGLSGTELDAAVEAATVAAAAEAKRQDRPPADPLPPTETPARLDLDAECAWLEQVSVAGRSRLVRQLLADADAEANAAAGTAGRVP